MRCFSKNQRGLVLAAALAAVALTTSTSSACSAPEQPRAGLCGLCSSGRCRLCCPAGASPGRRPGRCPDLHHDHRHPVGQRPLPGEVPRTDTSRSRPRGRPNQGSSAPIPILVHSPLPPPPIPLLSLTLGQLLLGREPGQLRDQAPAATGQTLAWPILATPLNLGARPGQRLQRCQPRPGQRWRGEAEAFVDRGLNHNIKPECPAA